MERIFFESPAWFLSLCVLFGLILALLVYYRHPKLSEWSRTKKMALAALRFLTGFLLSALLLSPFLKSFVTETVKPTLLFAIDNSMSMKAETDSTVLTAMQQQLSTAINDLQSDFDTDVIVFGKEVTAGRDVDYSAKETDLSKVIKYSLDQYNPDNLGSVVILTDGIYNRGYNPTYAAGKLASPIISVAIGDTIAKKDLAIKNIYHNKIAYLGDVFPIQIDLKAKNLDGQSSQIKLYKVESNKSRNELKSIPFRINADEYFTTIDFKATAQTSGINHYRLAVGQIAGESTTVNNYKDIYIDVIDARQSVLIYAASTHPDIAALKKALDTKKNYQVDVKYATDANVNWNTYDLVIFHSLPNRTQNLKSILKTLDQKRTARLYILGSESVLTGFNSIQQTIDASARGTSLNNATAIKAPVFNTFKVDEAWLNTLSTYPPLQSPFGQYQTSPGATPLLWQKIGSVATQYPLLALSKNRNIKEAVLVGEGLWRWRLNNYIQHERHDQFDDFISKVIQYLTIKEDRRRFKSDIAKNVYNENERIRIDAELYNKSYELINTTEALLEIKDTEGKNYEYTYNKVDQYYSLDLGTLPVGNYRAISSATFNGERLISEKRFSVQPVQLELYETTANHDVLRELALATNGQVISPDQIDQLSNIIRNHKNIKPVQYQQSKTTPFLNLRWLLGLLILTLAIEWIVRRYSGSY